MKLNFQVFYKQKAQSHQNKIYFFNKIDKLVIYMTMKQIL